MPEARLQRTRDNYGAKIIEVERYDTHIAFKTECGHWHGRPLNWNIRLGDNFMCYCSEKKLEFKLGPIQEVEGY